jgi:hypothetical protein
VMLQAQDVRFLRVKLSFAVCRHRRARCATRLPVQSGFVNSLKVPAR